MGSHPRVNVVRVGDAQWGVVLEPATSVEYIRGYLVEVPGSIRGAY